MIERYITSFFDGYVRLRHPALRQSGCEEQIRAVLGTLPGILSLTVNAATGSLLLEYNPAVLPSERLFQLAEHWARSLEPG